MLIVMDQTAPAKAAMSSGIATPVQGSGKTQGKRATMASTSVNALSFLSEGIRTKAVARISNERTSMEKNPTETMTCKW